MYKLIPSDETNRFYNVSFYKQVKKRATGNIETELGDTYYNMPKKAAMRFISHMLIKDESISLKDYLKKFFQNYRDCENS